LIILNFAFLNTTIMDLNILPLAFGPMQIVLVVLAVLLLFGGKKIPELMRGLGGGIKEFKKASQEDEDDKKDEEKK
jgi:sec-independent protein translocase protein TatA